MRTGQGLLLPSPPKGRELDGENDRGGVDKRGGCTILMQIKVENLGNMGRTMGWIHMAELVKSGKVHNLTNGVGCTLPYSRRGRRKTWGEEGGTVEFSR